MIDIEFEENNELSSDNDDDNLWCICSHCGGDGCACCDYEGFVYDPEPDGTN